MKLIRIYPQVILCPAFTPFMFRHTTDKSLDDHLNTKDNPYSGENRNGPLKRKSATSSGFHIWILGTLLNAWHMILSVYIVSWYTGDGSKRVEVGILPNLPYSLWL